MQSYSVTKYMSRFKTKIEKCFCLTTMILGQRCNRFIYTILAKCTQKKGTKRCDSSKVKVSINARGRDTPGCRQHWASPSCPRRYTCTQFIPVKLSYNPEARAQQIPTNAFMHQARKSQDSHIHNRASQLVDLLSNSCKIDRTNKMAQTLQNVARVSEHKQYAWQGGAAPVVRVVAGRGADSWQLAPEAI